MRPHAIDRWRMRAGWVVVAVLAAVSVEADAQTGLLPSLFPEGVPGYDTAPGVTVRSRLHPNLTAAGLRFRALQIFPTLDIATGYDSNVLGNAAAGRRGSWQLTTAPGIAASTDWSRNQIGAAASLQAVEYFGLPDQGQVNGSAAAGGRLDIGRDQLTIAAAHTSQHENGGGVNTIATTQPIAFQVDNLRAAYAVNRGRWKLIPALDVSGWRYGDATINGLPTSQAYRDRLVTTGSLTVRYELAPLRNILLVTRAIGQRYPHIPAGQPTSNSQGYQLLAGLDYDDNAVWRWRLLLGGEARLFSAPVFRPRNTVIAEAEVTWFPTPLTTMRFTLSRGTEDAAQEGVSGLIYTTAVLGIDHELRRDLLLAGHAGFQQASYFGGGRQTGYTVGVGMTWTLNRYARVSLTYDQTGLRGGQSAAQPLATDNNRGVSLLTFRLGL
ncbi:MAG: outer membrane beta-barrel protein [Proteobacteria bacterium]|nr:outer membrane beta-barrel protein [Pseudomonadota bacterium]